MRVHVWNDKRCLLFVHLSLLRSCQSEGSARFCPQNEHEREWKPWHRVLQCYSQSSMLC